MKVLFEKIEDISTDVLEFYTVRINDNALTEMELFEENDFPEHRKELEILYSVIDEMSRRGAKGHYFKAENAANALPRVNQEIITANKKDWGLRLYCIRLTDNVVVLLNGEIKTHPDPKKCSNVQRHFDNAVKIARKLDNLLREDGVNYEKPDCLLNLEIEL